MKTETINKLSWEDIREIATEVALMKTIPETENEYPTEEAFYEAVLARLSEKNTECIYGYTEEQKTKYCGFCSAWCKKTKKQ